MILILDNVVNSNLNILSCLILISIFKLNKEKYFNILILDIIINKIPIISLLIILIYYSNKLIFNKLIKNKLNKFILLCLYYFIFISLLYCINDYNFSYLYYIKTNLVSHIYNIFVYYLYIYYI